MDNPFSDLIPQQAQSGMPQQQAQSQGQNPFMDLVPQNVPQGTSTPQQAPPNMSPFMSAITGFNTGVGNLAHGVLQPVVESGVFGERVAQGSKNEAARREADYQTAAKSNPLTASIARFGGSIAPALMVPGMGIGSIPVKLAKGAALGAGMGAAEYTANDDRLKNSILGAMFGGAGAGVGQAIDAGIRYGAKKYAQSAIPGLVEKATDKIKGYITPEQGAKTLQVNYNKASGANNANWQKASGLANKLDSELKTSGKTFNTTPFDRRLAKFFKSTAEMEPAVRAKYDQALQFAKHIKEQAPQSFTGTMALRQNLNQEAKKFFEKQNIKATDKETNALINSLRASLRTAVRSNSKNVDKGVLSQFRDAWESANKSHRGLTEFVKTPNPQGTLKPRIPRREALSNQSLDAGALRQYLPPSLRGTEGINQLRKLTGNDDAARSYIMRNVAEGRSNQNAALNAYEKLSEPQRQALFNGRPEGDALKAASYAKNTVGENKGGGWGGFGHHAASLGLPGFLGFLGGKTIGDQDWDAALLTGLATAGAAKGAGKLLTKTATPARVIKAVNRAKTPNKNAGRFMSPALAAMFGGSN